jgi:hypothetical protein
VCAALLAVWKLDLTIALPSLNAIIMINSVQEILLSIFLTTHRITFLHVTSILARLPGVVFNEAFIVAFCLRKYQIVKGTNKCIWIHECNFIA